MKKQIIILFLLLTTFISKSQTVTYTASNENFPNPERGWYKYAKTNSIGTYSFLSKSSLDGYKLNNKITLLLRIYDLGAFINAPISQTFLNNIQTDFNTLRAAGFKCILRFRYSETDNIDATKSIILNHIEQLKTVTIPNQDVISVVEAGFIGKYGEWYYTSNYGDLGILTTQNNLDRKEIGLKIMELAPNRLIMFRTPTFQRLVGGTTPVSISTAYNNSINSRIGLHNDAFLASNSDMGTFINTTTDYTYLDAQSKYTFCGGESNDLFPTKQDCPVVFNWLSRFHYNYLNFGYHPDVISLWQTNGCYDEIQRRLGYRFELINSTISNNVLTINLRNVGFANIFNDKDVYLILKNQANSTEYSYKLNTNIKLWQPNITTTITENLNYSIPAGKYDLSLNIPDYVNISNPIYSIQLANTGVWNSTKGYNNLLQTFTKTDAVVVVPPPVVVVPPPVVQPVVVTITLVSNIIKVTGLTGTFTTKVYDLTGKLVSSSVNISKLRRGYYNVKITSNLTSIVYTKQIYKP
jgi:hypothetical protein